MTNHPFAAANPSASDKNKKNKNIVVLMGGQADGPSEREVSLKTGHNVCQALHAQGYNVTPLDICDFSGASLSHLASTKPYMIFNALHGGWGEDGRIQKTLESYNLPYTHSGPDASAIAMDKGEARAFFQRLQLPIPHGRIVDGDMLAKGHVLPLPYIIKPISDGSSLNIVLVREEKERPLEKLAARHNERFLAEEYIEGQEVTCGIFLDDILGVLDIIHSHAFFDYDAKYSEGGSQHPPTRLALPLRQRVEEVSKRAHVGLGCHSVTRADLMVSPRPRYCASTGKMEHVFLIEINTQPGLTSLSLVPAMAAHQGLVYAQFIERIVEEARTRYVMRQEIPNP